ncbi:MAG TPA: phosphonate ABC transporter, permease protein PhnE [Chthonomonadaceae bacterium]|nr:phosphonate ABC transporter, permease protein PhnE [Chthonomonadaceae bacterium]
MSVTATSPQPIPPPERDADQWRLLPPISLKLIGLALVLSLLLGWSAKRNDLTRLPGLLLSGVGESMGLSKQSEIGPAVRRFVSGLFPLVLWEKTDTTRVENFDPKRLPPFTHIVREPITEYHAVENKWVTVDTRDFLYDPFGYLKTVLWLMLQTIEIAVWGTLLALLVAIPQAYFAARNYAPNRLLYSLARGWTSFTRATPDLILALICVMIFGFGAIAGVITLAFNTSGFLGKFLADDIENADKGPQEALSSLGANKLKVLRFAVLPQVLPQYLAYVQYILERNVRSAAAIGVVGAGGIGMELKGRWDMYDYGHVSTVLLIMFLTAFALERVTQIVRTRLIK